MTMEKEKETKTKQLQEHWPVSLSSVLCHSFPSAGQFYEEETKLPYSHEKNEAGHKEP